MIIVEYLKLLDWDVLNKSPIAIVIGVVLAVFLGWRKINVSEYVTAGKETYNELKELYGDLKLRVNILEDQLESCLDELKKSKEI